jgi:phospholipid/cholesterol/gamma-HCH transport system substrate-binding protein
MGKNIIETLTGLVVLIIAAGFVYVAYNSADVEEKSGYSVYASFERADGLNRGSDVKISGIKVGSVTSFEIDPVTYNAKVELRVDDNIKLPDDSSAEIIGDGLLGGKYLAIIPGGSDQYLADKGVIKFTQGSISLEALIGKFIFNSADKEKDKKADAVAAPAAEQPKETPESLN